MIFDSVFCFLASSFILDINHFLNNATLTVRSDGRKWWCKMHISSKQTNNTDFLALLAHDKFESVQCRRLLELFHYLWISLKSKLGRFWPIMADLRNIDLVEFLPLVVFLRRYEFWFLNCDDCCFVLEYNINTEFFSMRKIVPELICGVQVFPLQRLLLCVSTYNWVLSTANVLENKI